MPWVPAPSRPCIPAPVAAPAPCLDWIRILVQLSVNTQAALHTLHRIIRTLSTVYYLAHQTSTQYGVLLRTLPPHGVRSVT